MATLLEAMHNVDKSDSNRTFVDAEALAHSLSVSNFYYGSFDEEEFDRRFTMYWLETWICTDSRVGIAAVYFDDSPVALFIQRGRKCDKHFDFIDAGVASCVQSFMQSITKHNNSFSLIPGSALHEEIEFGGWID